MLDPELIPTAIGGARQTRGVTVKEPLPPSRWRGLVLLRTGLALALWALWRRLRRRPVTAEEMGSELRTLFESLGGLWIKLGQLLAMRRDLLPAAFCTEIGRLQDRATGFPAALARRIVEEDLGASPDALFEEFDDVPFAAASIGQLHRARRDGVVLAVKIQRPHIAAIVERDLRYVRRLCLTLDRLGVRRNFHWHDLIYELTRAMHEELDYRLEATSMARMRRRLRRHGIYVPRLYRRLSSGRVLTMEFVSGVLMSDYVSARDADPAAAERWLAENEILPARVGRRLHLSLLRQILEDNLFHGDLHPGNILLLRRSRIALIDFGSIGTLEASFRRLYVMLNRAMAEGEYEKVADILSLIAPRPDPSIDWERVRRLVAGTLRQAEIRAWAPNLSYHERSMNAAMVEVARSLAGSRIPVGWTFMRVDRAHVTLDASLMYLIPNVNYVSLGRRYFREARRRAKGADVARHLADRLRRMRTTSLSDILNERLQLERHAMHGGASIFRQSRRHAEVLAAFASGYLARLCLAASVVLVALLALRPLSGPAGPVPLERFLPVTSAALFALGRPTLTALVVALLAMAATFLAVERRANLQRHDGSPHEEDQAEDRVR